MAQWQPGRTVEFVEESLSAIQGVDRFKGNRSGEPRRGRYTFACPRCGMHTYGGSKFCADCGYPLNANCPHCGVERRYEFQYAFCPECGGALGAGEGLEDERAERGAAGFALTKKETHEKGEGS